MHLGQNYKHKSRKHTNKPYLYQQGKKSRERDLICATLTKTDGETRVFSQDKDPLTRSKRTHKQNTV